MMRGGMALLLAVTALVALGYYFHTTSVRRYDAAVDARIEEEIRTVGLEVYRMHLAQERGDKIAALRAFYDSPEWERINTGFAALTVSWERRYPRLDRMRMLDDPLGGRGRLKAEFDERFAPGAFDLMQAEYENYRVEAPRRRIEAAERRAREREWALQYMQSYVRRHGRYPSEIPPMPDEQQAR